MKIIVGSTNPAKLEAVQQIFGNDQVDGIEVSSRVSSQPFCDEETLEGAINRARECAKTEKGVVGIGLEGGVMELENDLYLCNWGALVDSEENTFVAGGARIPLPDSIANELNKGKELGDVIDDYAKGENVRHNEGAIGVFTNELVNRSGMFAHIVQLLKGQYEFYYSKKGDV
ncbi:DUF84 family protein [Pontibacillus salipaludis]|uniref:inosine/xanthosine triphosphatase n=1 Tax=Pontibacillus salipaludis TaxID=1697394 RepID=A0ABQ1Q7V8_9BACI|nr:DUF84 family protein [Pontibacillus salipaludis]GGD17389.1 NTPase [Pontibacillus salipaludis]